MSGAHSRVANAQYSSPNTHLFPEYSWELLCKANLACCQHDQCAHTADSQ